jgi:hypothetical protein
MPTDSLIVSNLIDYMTRREENGELYSARSVLALLRGAADVHDPALAAKIGAYLEESRAAHVALICK